ncbi:MAG: PKD domain-containing protein, partial [Chthoniobacterales bacterium]
YGPNGTTGTGQPGVFDPFWFIPYAATMQRVPTFPTMGNHDIETANGAWYLSNFRLPQNGPPAKEKERNYSFDYGNAHFVVIDANAWVNPFDANRVAAIKSWLTSDLAGTQQRWKFVFFHQPAYTSSGNGVHDPEAALQNDVQPLCAQYRVQIVFQGHNHFYERINPIDGVNYITTGAGGRSLYAPTIIPTYSAVLNNSVYSFAQADISGGKLTLRNIDTNGTQIDLFTLDLDHPFKIDGLLDSPSYQRAANLNGLKLHAAIRGNFLYVATEDAGEGNDHFIYLNNAAAPMRAANWAKAGQVMSWSALLADENDTGFKGWFDGNEQLLTDATKYAATTSGLNNNGVTGNGVLEGTIDLAAHFGSFPQQLYLAAGPFATANNGALVSSAQVPIGNGDGSIQPNEFLLVNTRDIALDVPVSNAGADQSVEAGMQVALNGSALNPSGLPLTYAWTQLSGPAVMLNNASMLAASFTYPANVAQTTTLTFRFRVNDTRFDADNSVAIDIFPMLDSDGDGLSDQEEITGKDNSLTTASPAGQITDPNRADSDGDGVNDGDEALAGTNPNSAVSVFRITNVERSSGSINVQFASVGGRTYQLQIATRKDGPWTDAGSPLTATGASTLLTIAADPAQPFLRVKVDAN